MIGIFNSHNFDVYRGSDFDGLYKSANISYLDFEYGDMIKYSKKPVVDYMALIYSSFGAPSFTINNLCDSPVDCWIISSPSKHEIIYIEYWKGTFPERMYIFFNVKNHITSLFLKYLLEKAQ